MYVTVCKCYQPLMLFALSNCIWSTLLLIYDTLGVHLPISIMAIALLL